MKANDIYIKDWLDLKPYGTPAKTDFYYVKLCNKVKKVINKNHKEFIYENFDNAESFINILSCFVVSYFEDIISETNIWTTFVNKHKKLYGKTLPFYETEEYYENEINVQDIIFLIWYLFNTLQEERFINPFNKFFIEMAEDIYKIFDKEYEYAPENDELRSFYQISKNETDYYEARNLMDNLFFGTYLFYPDTLSDFINLGDEILENSNNLDEMWIEHIINDTRDNFLHNNHTALLALNAKEWAAELIGESHPLYKDYMEMSPKISGYFFYKGQDEEGMFIEHIASGKTFKVAKHSLDTFIYPEKIDEILYMGIVKWRGEWWFSGIYYLVGNNKKLIEEEKKSITRRSDVNFLDNEKVLETLKKEFESFKKFNNGKQIAFMLSEDIDDFLKKQVEFYNKSTGKSQEEFIKAKERFQKVFGEDNKDKSVPFDEISESGLVFFNPKGGVEIALAVNSAFPLPENKFFREENSREHIIRLLLSEDISPELVYFCIDNCKNDLKFFKEEEGKLLLDDIDFLLRFWKKNNYHPKPTVTIF